MLAWLKTRRVQVIILIALLVASGITWRVVSNQPTYTPYTVETQSLTDTLELSGKVEAATIATLRFGAGGNITYIGAKEGDKVAKWQTLASLDTRQVQKVLEQKLNLYAIQRATFDQTIDDNDNSVPGGDDSRELRRLLEKNQYQLDNTVKDVEYQDLVLRLSRIYSPLSGVLIHAPTSVSGVQVAPSDTWVVVDPTTLQFVADLDETDLAKVQQGQKVTVTLDSYPDKKIESEVSSIAYSPKETTTGTTYEVTVKLPLNELSNLRLGLNGTASVTIGEKIDVLTLPQKAISIEPEGTLVYLESNGKYTKQIVTMGVSNGETIEIVSGVKEGQTVYVKQE